MWFFIWKLHSSGGDSDGGGGDRRAATMKMAKDKIVKNI